MLTSPAYETHDWVKLHLWHYIEQSIQMVHYARRNLAGVLQFRHFYGKFIENA